MKLVTAKVYAAFSPAPPGAAEEVARAAAAALGPEPPVVTQEGDLLRLSWEGVYFPLEEVLSALAAVLPPEAEGRLDSIDLDAWTLTRHQRGQTQGGRQGEAFSVETRSLNHILDYSGH